MEQHRQRFHDLLTLSGKEKLLFKNKTLDL